MKSIFSGYFFNPTKGNLKIDKVIEELFNYISERPEKFYDIIIGCDSSSGEEPHFPIVVVILRVGEGGRFFLRKISHKDRKFYSWKTRILEEVFLSCQLALYLREAFKKKIEKYERTERAKCGRRDLSLHPLKQKIRYQFCYIHADVGQNGQTKDMIKEVTGLIRGNGFEPKIKPESFAATTVADKFS